MSYDPSHRMPPRQERSPYATPAEGWPPYRDGDHADGRYGTPRQVPATAGYRRQAQAAVATAAFPAVTNGYGTANGHGTANGYDWGANGYAGAADDFAGVPGRAHLGPGSYTEYTNPRFARSVLSDNPRLTAPDAGIYPDTWQDGQERRREASWRGPMVGAVTEILATGVVIGVSTLAAGLLRSAISPVSAMGTVFIDRTPATLRNFALQHFGTHGRTVLLLGMYVAFAVVAIAIGVAARRAAAVGVAGIAAFTLFAAFVTITRPAGHVGDAGPAVIGGVAGVAALLWLVRASAPAQEVAPARHGHGGTRRRTR